MRELLLRAGLCLVCATLMGLGGCGGDEVNNPDPRIIAGGGVGDGAIKGALHVYVVDADSGNPVAGAQVRVGDAADTAPLVGTTDSAGLASFKDGKLKGPQTITATATGHVAGTWIGADGANVTIPLEAPQAGAPATAKASGTIQGWDTRPAPEADHLTLAYVGYSYTEQLDAPENSIAQGTVTVAGIDLPANICLKVANQSACSWQLNTRTGKQVHWAVVIDVDTNGTLTDRSDDTYTVIDYAFLLDQNLAADQESTGEVLVPVGSSGLTNATVAFQAAPTNLTNVVGLPLIKMGDSGTVALAFAPFGPDTLTQPVPALTGPLANASYDFVARAQADANTQFPSSTILKRAVALGAAIDFGAWLSPPTSFSATGGNYSFSPSPEADLHTVRFLQSGTTVWNVGLLDGRTSFTLPSLSSDPLPAGELQMRVEALKVPSFDATDFSVEALTDSATQLASGQLAFTR
jgi:hypothetical protein